ncbi:hypothetical protein [Burkholderia phage BCSR5]|nr:hypothetical protein [Burkholderia phage BCSR5]
MQKKDVVGGKVSSKSMKEAFKCSECLHFKKHAHSDHDEVCSKEGVRGFAIAPKCFTPDVTQIAGNTDQFVQLAMLLDSYTPKQQRILLGVLRGARKSKKKALSFGTKVYFLMHGKEYISNYFFAYVMGYSSKGEMMLTGSPDVKSRGASFFYFAKDPDGLLTESQWKVKRKALFAAGKINDPDTRKFKVKVDDAADHKVPSIDDAPASWHDKKDTKKRRRNDPLEFAITR